MFRAFFKPEIICAGVNIGIQAFAASKVAEYLQKPFSSETPSKPSQPEEPFNQSSIPMRK